MEAPPSDPSISTEAWLDRFFDSYFRHRPVNASFIGVHDHDIRLPDFSDMGVGEMVSEMESLLAESEALTNAAPGSLSPESVDVRLARGFLRTQLWECRSTHFHMGNPSLYTGEAAFGVMGLFLNHSGSWPHRIEAATERMEAMGILLSQARENIQAAPAEWTQRAIRECRGLLAFLRDGVEILDADAQAAHQTDPAMEVPTAHALATFRSAAAHAATAVEEHRRHLESDTPHRTTDGFAAGEEAFSLYLSDGHFLRESPAEIVRYAEDAMAEAHGWLARHASDFGASDATEALAGLADLHPTADGYYARYQETWDNVRALTEARDLLTWPEFPIRYVPRPEWSRAAAPDLYFLFYRSPAAFNRPPVHDYLVTPLEDHLDDSRVEALLRANNDSAIKLNHVVHHGSVGHHVQNWHAFRAQSRVGRMAAVDCASRVAMFCGGTMAEGWACYATDLMSEFGALTPLEEYAEVQGRARMCARTIVDAKLHCGEFTLEQAAVFYHKNAGMSPTASLGEAVKNSMFPGAAVMYLLGTDRIHDLRRGWMAESTSRTLKQFHDTFLSHGSIPVALIAESMLGEESS